MFINKKIVYTVCLLATPLFAEEDPPFKKAKVRLGIATASGGLFASGQTFANLPLTARRVPTHPDDPQSWNMTIPNQSFRLPVLKNASVKVGPTVMFFERVLIQGGLLQSILHDNRGPMYSINQYGVNERGYGTSLVTLSVAQYLSFRPGMYAQAQVKVHKRFWLMGGWTKYDSRINANQGYDRYNAYTTLRTLNVATVHHSTPYFGMVIPLDNNFEEDRGREGYQIGLEFFGGPGRIKSYDIGNGMSGFVPQRKSFLFGFGITAYWLPRVK